MFFSFSIPLQMWDQIESWCKMVEILHTKELLLNLSLLNIVQRPVSWNKLKDFVCVSSSVEKNLWFSPDCSSGGDIYTTILQ